MENREKDTKRTSDNIAPVTHDLYDIDWAIQYYFNEVIKPRVIDNDTLITVPVIYGSPDKWKSTRHDGFFRDEQNKVQVPLIMFRRTGFTNSREYPRQLDANKPEIYVTHASQYSEHNRYDHFSALYNKTKQKQFHNVIIPKYIEVTYDCVIWTRLLQQMNKLQEIINFAESSYWGEPNKFKFAARIPGFDTSIELNMGEDRAVKSTFTINMNGFIVAQNLQQQLIQSSEVTYSATKIILTEDENM